MSTNHESTENASAVVDQHLSDFEENLNEVDYVLRADKKACKSLSFGVNNEEALNVTLDSDLSAEESEEYTPDYVDRHLCDFSDNLDEVCEILQPEISPLDPRNSDHDNEPLLKQTRLLGVTDKGTYSWRVRRDRGHSRVAPQARQFQSIWAGSHLTDLEKEALQHIMLLDDLVRNEDTKLSEPADVWRPRQENEPGVLRQGFTGYPQGLKDPKDQVNFVTAVGSFLTIFSGVLNIVLEETNRYYGQNFEASKPERPVAKKLPDITLEELYRFLAITIQMGEYEHNQLYTYWSTEPRLFTPWYGQTLARDRYMHILMNLHFENQELGEELRQDDRLWAIRRIFNELTDKFLKFYAPSREVVLDEVIAPYKGRVIFKYMPKKRKRYGIKIYRLCDSSGYTLNWTINTGKSGQITDVGRFTTDRMVLNLTKSIEGFGHVLYMDKSFNSPMLYRHLLKAGIYACGTVCPTIDGMPVDFHPKLRPLLGMSDDSRVRYLITDDGLTALLYRDKRDVTLLSSAHDALDEVQEVQITDDGRVQPLKPAMIRDYNKHMRYIDLFDQMICGYSLHRKTSEWTKKIFFHFLDTAVFNAFILFKSSNDVQKSQTLGWFRGQLVNELVQIAPGGKPQRQASSNIDPSDRLNLSAAHFPKVSKKYRRCVVCYANKRRRETRYLCERCQVHLCIDDSDATCFKKYHTLKSYT